MAQMALSAVARTQEQVNMGLLVDILRGSSKYEVLERGYDKIKTYGVGRNVPFMEWQSYVWQIIQLGYLEIAYEDKHKLKMTAAASRADVGARSASYVFWQRATRDRVCNGYARIHGVRRIDSE